MFAALLQLSNSLIIIIIIIIIVIIIIIIIRISLHGSRLELCFLLTLSIQYF